MAREMQAMKKMLVDTGLNPITGAGHFGVEVGAEPDELGN